MRWPFTREDAKDVAASGTVTEWETAALVYLVAAVRWFWSLVAKLMR